MKSLFLFTFHSCVTTPKSIQNLIYNFLIIKHICVMNPSSNPNRAIKPSSKSSRKKKRSKLKPLPTKPTSSANPSLSRRQQPHPAPMNSSSAATSACISKTEDGYLVPFFEICASPQPFQLASIVCETLVFCTSKALACDVEPHGRPCPAATTRP